MAEGPLPTDVSPATTRRPAGQQAERDSTSAGADVAAVIGGLVRGWQRERSVEATLDAITHAAVDSIPGARYAGITLVATGRRLETAAATDPVVNLVDQAQYDTGEGPCLTALFDEVTVSAPDIAADPRWPAWRGWVSELGIASMLSFQLFVDEQDLGALNLYATDTDAFDANDVEIGSLFAAHSAVALASAREQAGLRAALTNRDLIGQAKGILMERYRLSADDAFQLLVRASQSTHIKLHEVARRIIQPD